MRDPRNYRVKQIIGYALLIIAFISFKLRFAISQAFLSPTYIIIIAVILGLGGFILASLGTKENSWKNGNLENDLINKLKQNGEKITLTPDNCKVVENNYYEEATNHGTDTATVANALHYPNRNVTQVFVMQSAIIFYYQTSEKKLKLTSQTFPCTGEQLLIYLRAERVKLYIDRFDKEKYAFELK